MYPIPNRQIASWSMRNGVKIPVIIDLNCPGCGRLISFSAQWRGDTDEIFMATTSLCPACSSLVTFVLVDIYESGKDPKQGKLYAHPIPKVRHPVNGIDTVEEIPEALVQAYMSALKVYNAREWAATAVLCRRLLEGIAKTLLPEDKQKLTLSRQLEALPEYRDLDEPILTLSDAIRKGGNLGAHFDLEKEPDEETATLMIELLEYLVEYMFVLPKRIGRLHDTINNLGNR